MRNQPYGARCLALLSLALSPLLAATQNARFDLTGPKIDIRVTRGGSTLPIAQVPNILPGDKIWVHPDLPQTQSAHLIAVVVFLRGTTNPPPDNWFTLIETWNKKIRAEGVTITVPDEAQQALLFVAPETGGDFSTLKSAVRGRPGVFVRAAADLNEASFEQARIERYLDAMRKVPQNDPKAIAEHSQKLAATLNLKPNNDCFKQPVDQQVSCLRQTGSQSLLDDGHGQTIAAALSSGTSSDLINATAATPLAGAGLYSAYVGAIVDVVRLMSGLHTAQYQYIPAIAFPQEETLNLRLNAPPSFHNPKSVIVIGLPAIQKAVLPPLRLQDAHHVSCLLQPNMALPLEGAPLVFSTGFAHNLVLRVNRGGEPTDLPLRPDPFEGGLVVVDTTPPRKPLHDIPLTRQAQAADQQPSGSPTDLRITGTVHGLWGFDSFDGPTVPLQQLPGKDWKIVGNSQLLAGKENHILLRGSGSACVQRIEVDTPKGRTVNVDFKPAPAALDGSNAADNALDLTVPLKNAAPGGFALHVKQFGAPSEDKLDVTAYNDAIHLDSLHIHSGDHVATLTGSALTDVESVDIAGTTFTPDNSSDASTLHLEAKSGVQPGDHPMAKVKLHDGRTLPFAVKVDAPRPGLQLLSKSSAVQSGGDSLPVTLTNKDAIPIAAPLTFVVQSDKPLPRTQKIEIATTDNSVRTTLSLQDSSLILQDARTAIATLTPLQAFGQSAFGKLQMRPVAEDGTAGEWIPLGTLVRIPAITKIDCAPSTPTCTLSGRNLFLITSVSPAADGATPTAVPTGFAANSITVPTPADRSTLYLKLRDDPETAATVKLPEPLPTPAPVPAATEPPPTPATPTSTPAATPPAPPN
jgi:hypothetical protein